MRRYSGMGTPLLCLMIAVLFSLTGLVVPKPESRVRHNSFRRTATFPVYPNWEIDEEDPRKDKVRSAITIHKPSGGNPTYPALESADRAGRLPIPWGALSALAADPVHPGRAYTACDSFYRKSRILELDFTKIPAVIKDEIVLADEAGDTVDLDIEGLSVSADGGFWVVSEGAGSVDDANRPVASPNRLLKVAPDGTIVEDIRLPDAVSYQQRRFGFEGVAESGWFVYVAFQRGWALDPDGRARIGRYDTGDGTWSFYYYPLDAPTSPNGGWVGLSEITALGDSRFAVIERDNQAGADARIKRIYRFSVEGIVPQPQGSNIPFPELRKILVRDLIPDLKRDNRPILEKVEGLMVTPGGEAFIATDNDGLGASGGDTQFIHLGRIFPG